MRRIIASTLLFSSMFFTAAAHASSPAGDSTASTVRVSTGITPPKLLNSLNLSQFPATSVPSGVQISVSFVVDEKGQPQNIQIVQGYDPYWNASIVDAIGKLHYRPASMDNQPISMGMNLIVTLTH